MHGWLKPYSAALKNEGGQVVLFLVWRLQGPLAYMELASGTKQDTP